jgi:hypothetical protein
MRVLTIDNFKDPVTSILPRSRLFTGLKEKGLDVHVIGTGNEEVIREMESVDIPVYQFYPKSKNSH